MNHDATPRPWHIALISFVVLTLELAFIRQIPAEVMIISYFTNLILMSTFFGLGLGCILQRTRNLEALLPLGLSLVAAFVYFGRGIVVFDNTHAVHYWLEYTAPTVGVAPKLPLFPAALAAFVVCALPFVAIGQRLAVTMNAHPRLVGYGWDILGSLLGTLAFAAGSAALLPPWIWPPLTMLLWAAVMLRSWPRRGLFVAAGSLFLVFSQSAHPSTWSPYYFVQHAEEKLGLRVWVNSSFHQFAADLNPAHTELADHQRHVLEKFAAPYDVYRAEHGGASPGRVLILGAGTGNDVNVALHNGAARITAVEIDPVILQLGKQHNRTAPYADPRVRAVVDDARHFLRTSQESYDLIVFGTLDSQTLLSSQANLRLENYVYTAESFSDVRTHLTSGGMVAAYYFVSKPWLFARLYRTVCGEFSGHCRLFSKDPYLFNAVFMGAVELDGFRSDPKLDEIFAHGLPSTDDWPFLYLEQPTVAPIYLELIASVSLLIVAAFLLLRRIEASRAPVTNFLLLGAGFTLMESAAVVRLALLFGSTWVINAIVFSSALAMMYLANLAVQRDWAPALNRAWLCLLACVALNYVIAPAQLLGLATPLRAVACGLLIGLPVFFAAVCFSRLFATQASSGYALGINLVGAMAGGFVEYLSMLLGMRAVWLLVMIVYLGAYLLTMRSRATARVNQPAQAT